jgi:hypothetical protein
MAKKLPISLGDETEAMLVDIQARAGLKSLNGAVNFCIFEAHRGLFPAYMKTQRKGLSRTRAERREENRTQEEEDQHAICEELGGKIEGEGPSKVCIYHTYQLRKRYEQRVSLGMLNDEMIRHQYDPSKEQVLKLKEAGKCDW